MSNIQGWINLYKPKNITSFKAINEIKKKYNLSKIGHAGTLDPMAEGVLPIAVGKTTKLIQYISTDLNYSIKHRKIQVKRVFGIMKLAIESKLFPIASTVYMNQNIKQKLKKEKIFLIKIDRQISKIKNRKKIYSKKLKNVIGLDIQNPKLKNDLKIYNNGKLKIFYQKLRKIV